MKLLAGVVAVVVACVWPFVYPQPYFIHIGLLAALFATVALATNLMLRLGQLSMAQAGFMGIGAYASALLVMRLGVPFVVAFFASGILVAALAVLAGPIFLRIKGMHFVLVTFALGQVINLNFQEWTGLFGGNNGLAAIPPPSFFGISLEDPRQFYLAAVALLAVSFALVSAVYRSDLGAAIDSIREDERLTGSLGLHTLRYRIFVFALSSFITGLAGSLYAHTLGFLSPEAFSFLTIVNMVIMNILGGIASPLGPVIGALILVPLPEFLQDAQEYQVLLYGVLLVLMQLFMREGLIGLWRRWVPA